MSEKIKVEAVELGYYGHVKQRVGDVFLIDNIKHLSKRWMRRVSDDTPLGTPRTAGPINKENIPDSAEHTTQYRTPVSPSELVPANVLNVHADVVLDSLKAARDESRYTVEQLKTLYKAEEEGKNRVTILTEIDSMIADAAVAV